MGDPPGPRRLSPLGWDHYVPSSTLHQAYFETAVGITGEMATQQERDEAARWARRILRERAREGTLLAERERIALELMAEGRLEEARRLGRSIG